ncbi:uncharacterized protein [Haliotis asinina]|uniref:uncharacterized protein n=1 Tax=Haliotis asinina TaxID=109174 RepID=UPI0035326DE8
MVQTLKPKKVAVTALTGIASLQYGEVGGQTIHHWCGYMDGRYSATELEDLLLQSDVFHDAKDNILTTEVLIIDEVGMMSRKMFEVIENVCGAIRKDKRPFGGIQVIASGDFKQLPPVPNHFQDGDGSFIFQSDRFRRVFPHLITLKEVVRQTERDLISAINELCDGCPTEETHNLMESLRRPLQYGEGQPPPVRIYGTNFEVEFENFCKMNEMDGEIHLFKAKDSGETNLDLRLSKS